MLKLCNTCKQKKQITNFNFKIKNKNRRQPNCKDCQSKQKRKLREWWQEHKKQFKCKCGESHPACIEFHHHQKNKEGNVSSFIGNGSIKKALKEVDKCIPICRNCHAKLHYKLRNKGRANN